MSCFTEEWKCFDILFSWWLASSIFKTSMHLCEVSIIAKILSIVAFFQSIQISDSFHFSSRPFSWLKVVSIDTEWPYLVKKNCRSQNVSVIFRYGFFALKIIYSIMNNIDLHFLSQFLKWVQSKFLCFADTTYNVLPLRNFYGQKLKIQNRYQYQLWQFPPCL